MCKHVTISLFTVYAFCLSEQRLEKQVLLDQCQQLHQEHRDLSRTVEHLRRRRYELIQNQQLAEEERQRSQGAIDNLIKTLKLVRR